MKRALQGLLIVCMMVFTSLSLAETSYEEMMGGQNSSQGIAPEIGNEGSTWEEMGEENYSVLMDETGSGSQPPSPQLVAQILLGLDNMIGACVDDLATILNDIGVCEREARIARPPLNPAGVPSQYDPAYCFDMNAASLSMTQLAIEYLKDQRDAVQNGRIPPSTAQAAGGGGCNAAPDDIGD